MPNHRRHEIMDIMNTLKMLLTEIGYRKLNFVLSLSAVIVAVTLFVAGPVLIDAYGRQTDAKLAHLEDETRKLMRDMGFNLLIVHEDTNMSDFWADDFAKHDMPQEYVDRLAADERLFAVAHLVATLQKKETWNNRKVLLAGYLSETPQPHRAQTEFAKKRRKKKTPMGYNIEPGTVYLGFELGAGRKEGEIIEVLGKPFRIARIIKEQGSKEDIAIKMHLSDAQALLKKDNPPRINQILALGCNCTGSDLPDIRRQLEQVLPETQITEFRSIALARAEQRAEVKQSRLEMQQLVETLAAVITPIIVLASAVWVGLLALTNVRERQTEIGILRAIGKGSGTIAALFLGKAVLLGLLGATVGFALGSALAAVLGVHVLGVAAERFTIHYDILLVALLGAPLLSAVASYLPTLSALMQDPAVVLRDQ